MLDLFWQTKVKIPTVRYMVKTLKNELDGKQIVLFVLIALYFITFLILKQLKIFFNYIGGSQFLGAFA